jgi:hypothetical protein
LVVATLSQRKAAGHGSAFAEGQTNKSRIIKTSISFIIESRASKLMLYLARFLIGKIDRRYYHASKIANKETRSSLQRHVIGILNIHENKKFFELESHAEHFTSSDFLIAQWDIAIIWKLKRNCDAI